MKLLIFFFAFATAFGQKNSMADKPDSAVLYGLGRDIQHVQKYWESRGAKLVRIDHPKVDEAEYVFVDVGNVCFQRADSVIALPSDDGIVYVYEVYYSRESMIPIVQYMKEHGEQNYQSVSCDDSGGYNFSYFHTWWCGPVSGGQYRLSFAIDGDRVLRERIEQEKKVKKKSRKKG